MKLLDKKRILANSNEQKKTQIDEGVAIARSVDKLRDELGSLEKQRQLFHEGSKAELEKAIGPLTDKKESIENDIIKRESELRELRKPLDDEWATLGEKKEEFALEVKALEVSKAELSNKEKENEEKTERINLSKNAIDELERSTRQLNQYAQRDQEAAAKLKTDTDEHCQIQRQFIDEETRKIILDREQVDITLRDIERRTKALDVREEAINVKDRMVNDKYEQLLRTIKRVK